MKATACRRFEIADAMILIAAAAVASYLLRIQADLNRSYGPPTAYYYIFCEEAERWVPPILLPLTLAALLVRLKKPRPVLARIFRQRGALASVTIVVSIIILGFFACARLALHGLPMFFKGAGRVLMEPGSLMADQIYLGGPIIVGSWMSLALGRGLRREPGWIDRLGTTIGAAWVFLWFLRWSLDWLG